MHHLGTLHKAKSTNSTGKTATRWTRGRTERASKARSSGYPEDAVGGLEPNRRGVRAAGRRPGQSLSLQKKFFEGENKNSPCQLHPHQFSASTDAEPTLDLGQPSLEELDPARLPRRSWLRCLKHPVGAQDPTHAVPRVLGRAPVARGHWHHEHPRLALRGSPAHL